MRRIGIIGGMSWYSTLEYYTVINTEVQRRLGGHHSAGLLVHSLDFDAVRACQLAGDWAAAGRILADAAAGLEGAGAEAVLIGTNLMHKVAPAVEDRVGIPLLHIGDAIGRSARDEGCETLGILGTRWTMTEPFYSERLTRHGVETVIPDAGGRDEIDAIIFDELTQGIVTDASRIQLAEHVTDLADRGADAVVLACTELELSLHAEDAVIPLIPSARIHALAAVEFMLADEPDPR